MTYQYNCILSVNSAYFNEGFLHLEHLTSLAIIQWITGNWPDEISSVAMRVSTLSVLLSFHYYYYYYESIST